ncbi:phage tail protein [Halopseudomonas aestusnigri]|jgi:hypothetical protein|uniref:phage tail tube protein n=1 Tax=Halopseudomonas aestusnigri TaxID=857252 RepID=UPI001E290199|nr:phage tail tube protein [Halopseudomonas aestusnigri]UGV30961.1 phage tail protein [Halopseudomonas aestusnigri]
MAMKTQGSQLYALLPTVADPAVLEVVKIDCMNNFNGGGNPADQIVVECLDKFTREFLRGMRTPSQATFTLDADPRNASHVRLHTAAESDDEVYDSIKWAHGWSDGFDIPPTLNSEGDDFELPTTRTWFLFDGYVNDFPFDFPINSTVKTAVAIQRSGPGAWIKKVTP